MKHQNVFKCWLRVFLVVTLVTAVTLVWNCASVYGQSQRVAHKSVYLPDPSITPGKSNPLLTEEVVCSRGFSTKTVRHVTQSTKRKVYALYNRKQLASVCCEVDHLIPLTLGGSNSILNLWPQPYLPEPGAHEKDVLENWAHRQVCETHAMSLGEAQDAIALNWWQLYQQMRATQATLDRAGERLTTIRRKR